MGVDSGRKTGPHMTKDRAPSDLVAVTGDQTADWSTPGAESTPTWPHPNQECSITTFSSKLFLPIPPGVALTKNPFAVLLICPSTSISAAPPPQDTKPWPPPASLPGHYHLPESLLTTDKSPASLPSTDLQQSRLILLNAHLEIISNSKSETVQLANSPTAI